MYKRQTLHYPDKDTSFSILNFLSKSSKPKTEKAILNHLGSEQPIKRNDLINELDRLRTDDYLVRKIKNEERVYRFKYEILRKWWKINKSY